MDLLRNWTAALPFKPVVGLLVVSGALYLGLVRVLRYRRRDELARRFAHLTATRESYASMTVEDATFLNQELALLEFPLVFSRSLFFALFRVGSSRPHLSFTAILTG
jgi:hypothetical protein